MKPDLQHRPGWEPLRDCTGWTALDPGHAWEQMVERATEQASGTQVLFTLLLTATLTTPTFALTNWTPRGPPHMS